MLTCPPRIRYDLQLVNFPRVNNVAEPVRIEALIAEASIKTLNNPAIGRQRQPVSLHPQSFDYLLHVQNHCAAFSGPLHFFYYVGVKSYFYWFNQIKNLFIC